VIDGETRLCCLIGDPVAHSLSPLVHNHGYKVLGLNFVYVTFRIKEAGPAISAMRNLGIRGMSITIPHKNRALDYVDEMDDTAREIGAINTILNHDGQLKGYNTDYDAAIKTLQEKTTLEGKNVVLVGAGATALTIATALKGKGCRLTILNRTPRNASRLATRVEAAGAGGFDLFPEISRADVLINATPVGMWPEINELVVPTEYLHPGLSVFDVNYHPRETRLLSETKRTGGKAIYGYGMFLNQAARQFELFTGEAAPVKEMGKILLKTLEGEESAAISHRR